MDMKKNMQNVNVVVGILCDGSNFLVERRRIDEEIDPGIVCLPGGHVRIGEDREEALKRELREELGIEVKGTRFICRNLYIASNGEKQDAYCYLVTAYEGTLVCNSAQEIFWEDDVEKLSLEVDRNTIKKLKETLQR